MLTVLYVDDEPGLLELGKQFLESTAGFTVETVTSAGDALAMLPQKPYDGIISDYQMPEMDGIAFLKAVRASGNTIPFILFTGRGREEIVIEAINNGADFYLQKGGDPVSQFAELAHKIRQAVARRTAELDRIRSEEKFSKLFVANPSLEAITDFTSGTLIDVNEAWVLATGYARQEVIGKSTRDLNLFIDYADRERMASALKKEGIVQNIETRIRTKSGQIRILDFTGQFIRVGDRDMLYSQAIDITERKEAEDALRESREQLRRFMDSATDAFTIWDHSLNLVDLNRAALAYLPAGTKKEDLIGKNYAAFMPGSVERGEYNRYLEVIRTGVPFSGTAMMPDPQYGQVWLNVRCFRVGDGLGIVTSDITQQKLAENALRESEEKYRMIIENLQDTYYRTDADGRLVMISPSGVRSMGYRTAAEMLGKPVREFYANPDDYESVIREIGAQRSVTNREIRLKRADGTILTALYSSNAIAGADGAILGSEGIIRDITDYRKASLALRESEQKYHSLFDNAVIGIFRYSPADKRLDINPAFAKIFGYDSPEALIRDHPDTPAMMFVRPEDRQMVYDMLAATGRITNVESEQWHKDGHTIWIAINAQRVRNDAGEVFLIEGTVEEITARKLAADELRAAHEQITASEEELRSQLEELAGTQDVLKKQQEQLTEVADMVPGVVYQFYAREDGTRGMYYISRRAAEVFGFSGDTPDFFPWFTARVDEQDRPAFLTSIEEVVRSAAPWSFEGRFVKPSGEQIWFQGMSRPVRHGNELVYNGILLDITGRRRMEEQLRESEERFRSTFEQAAVGIAHVSPEGRFLRTNRRFCDITGYSQDEILSLTFQDITWPADLQEDLDQVTALIEGRIPTYSLEKRYLRKDGTLEWVNLTVALVRGEDGRPKYFISVIEDIQKRKQAEEALRESEERYRLLIDNIPFGITLIDADHRVILSNAAQGQMFDTDPGLWVGRYCYREFEKRDAVCKHCPGTRAMATGKCTDVETEGVRDDGTRFNARIHAIPLPDPKGRISGFIEIVEDITERKKAEDALRESEARLRSILRGSPALQFVLDSSHRVISWNKAIEEYSGIKAADIIGTRRQWEAFYPKERPVLADILVDGNPEMIDEWYAGKFRKSRYVEGAYEAVDFFPTMGTSGVWLAFTAAPVRDAAGAIIGAVETLEDITDRKRAEDARKESEEKFSKTFQSSPDLILLSSIPDARVLDVNDSAQQITGYSREEMVGTTISDLGLWIDDDAREQYKERVRREGTVLNFEADFRRKDGRIIKCLISGTIFQLASGPCFISVVRDITERKHAEEALRAANKKLNLLSSITRHDMFNQLTALTGYLEMSRQKTRSRTITEYLEKSARIAETLGRQIRFTRDYQDLGIHAPSWQNVSVLIHKAMAGLPLQDIRVEIDRSDLEVFADPLLEKVFYNLMDNALRYGGDMMRNIRVFSCETKTGLTITFMDDGGGIGPEGKQRLFERGFGKNTGLGLFLSREILSLTGITICETGELGKGARFEMVVPAGAWRLSRERSQDGPSG